MVGGAEHFKMSNDISELLATQKVSAGALDGPIAKTTVASHNEIEPCAFIKLLQAGSDLPAYWIVKVAGAS